VRTEGRFPRVGADEGHYESFYIKATRPGGGQGLWVRYTVHKRPGTEPTASLWLTLFDADAPGPVAAKATFPAPELAAPDGSYIQIDGAELNEGNAAGAIETNGAEASWDLTFTDPGAPLFHLPYARLYDAALPRTKLLTPYPSARFSGVLGINGERIEVDAWPGMVGHNWGAEHAERWVWIHAPELDGSQGSYLDVGAGRIKVGPLTIPWIANGALRLDGVEHRLGGLGSLFTTKLDARPTSCQFALAGKGVKLRGEIASEPRNFVAWIYADPEGPEHHSLNCSIADIELEIDRDGSTERISLSGCAAYEYGTRDTDHGIPLQPHPDG